MDDRRNLEETLLAVQAACAATRHDWWILGSAAVALHGANPGPVNDVDVLLDRRDAGRVLAVLDQQPVPGTADARFRSLIFNRWHGAPLPVEIFADFDLRSKDQWHRYRPVTRTFRSLGDATGLPVPVRAELIGLLNRFGRPKDLVRAAALNQSARFPSRSETA